MTLGSRTTQIPGVGRVQNKQNIKVSCKSIEIKENAGIWGGPLTVARYGGVSLASGECLPVLQSLLWGRLQHCAGQCEHLGSYCPALAQLLTLLRVS